MAASFSVFNWLSSPSINKVDTHTSTRIETAQAGRQILSISIVGTVLIVDFKTETLFFFIWVFFCKFAFRVERIKRKERKTSYSAVDHCMLRHYDTHHFELSSVLHLIKKKYWPMYSSSDIRSAKNSATLGKEANLIVAESNGWEGFPSIPKPQSLTNVIRRGKR